MLNLPTPNTIRTLLTILLFSVIGKLSAQNRIIEGRVIDEQMEIWPYGNIYDEDTVLLGKTDAEGKFKLNITKNTQILIFSAVGFEWTKIKLNNNCNTVEVVMMYNVRYHYISSNKTDRIRLRRFNKLEEIHSRAFETGLFINNSPCYYREFKPIKPSLDSIRKVLVKKQEQIALTFNKLGIGDTIKIPFSENHYDGKETKRLINYSYVVDSKNFDCIIKATVLNKDTKKSGFNITLKIIDCDLCKGSLFYENKELKVNDVITYNMKYFKLLND